MFQKTLLLTIACLVFACAASAQTSQNPPAKLEGKLDQLSDWMGEWHCDGKFVKSGKAISSTIRFSPRLEGRWIEMQQDDLPPNRFHAVEFWGYDQKQSKFLATVFDNFTESPRQFEADKISDGTLTLNRTIAGDSQVTGEQFIFENSNNKLKVTYQVMRSGSSSWAIGDVLNCVRP